MTHLALTPLAEGSTGIGKQLGASIGSGGFALVITVYLIAGLWGGSRIKIRPGARPVLGYVAGQLFTTAGTVWQTPAELTRSFNDTFTSQDMGLGTILPGALALCIAIVIYGFDKLPPWLEVFLGMALVTQCALAGSPIDVPGRLLAAALQHMLGVG
ncbi:hypothetical protein [Kitasatospora sp. NPDC088783]|uniref:hypothetical protein n=1 Tax=Kitasatospora sp. NPDC088783 TaxID=3364077 RepID=UPI0038155C89